MCESYDARGLRVSGLASRPRPTQAALLPLSRLAPVILMQHTKAFKRQDIQLVTLTNIYFLLMQRLHIEHYFFSSLPPTFSPPISTPPPQGERRQAAATSNRKKTIPKNRSSLQQDQDTPSLSHYRTTPLCMCQTARQRAWVGGWGGSQETRSFARVVQPTSASNF